MDDRYYFHLSVEKNKETVLDVGLAAGNDPHKAQLTLNRLLKEYIDPRKAPEAPAPKQEPPAAKMEELPPVKQAVPVRPAAPEGKQGCLLLHCTECGDTFGTYLPNLRGVYHCKCGHTIRLDVPFARYSYTCSGCGDFRYGQTNSEDPEIQAFCKCGTKATMRWDPKEKKYKDCEVGKS